MAISASLVKDLRERTGAAMMACKKALEEANGDMELAIEILRKAGIAKAAKRADKTAAEGKIAIAVSENGQNAFMAEVNCETDFVARDSHFNQFVQKVSELGLAHHITEVKDLLHIKASDQTVEEIRQNLVNTIGENIQIRRVAYLTSTGVIGTYCHSQRIGVMVALDTSNLALAKDIAMHIAASTPQAIYPQDVSAELVAKEREIFAAQAQTSGKPANIIEKMIEGRVDKFLKEISLLGQPFVKDPNRDIESLLKEHKAKVTAFIRFEVGEGIVKETQSFADEVMAQVQGK